MHKNLSAQSYGVMMTFIYSAGGTACLLLNYLLAYSLLILPLMAYLLVELKQDQ